MRTLFNTLMPAIVGSTLAYGVWSLYKTSQYGVLANVSIETQALAGICAVLMLAMANPWSYRKVSIRS